MPDKMWVRMTPIPRSFSSSAPRQFGAAPVDILAVLEDKDAMTSATFSEHGFRIEEIASSEAEGGANPGWYYGRPDGEGNLGEKVGPFQTREEALRHLEEELFGDDED